MRSPGSIRIMRCDTRRGATRRRRRILRGLLLAAATAAPLVCALPAAAVEPPSRAEAILFTADTLSYDQERRVIKANGNVEAVQGDRVLKADEITYDETRDRLIATGNVSLTEPSGEVVFASQAEITGDLKSGVIEDLRLILTDGTRVAAASGRRTGGTETELTRTVYSPCDLCAEEPTRPPLWQIKAAKVRHDQNEKIVEFSDAWMEVGGVPVFYLPYFYQPDPSVKRKTGLLVPTFGNSSDFGLVAEIPVFIALSPQADMTLTPWFTTKEGALLEAEYRRELSRGRMEFDGSLTRDSTQKTRGHLFGEVRYDIDERWRSGLDIERTLDRTYLRRYGFSDQQTLTSRLYGEAFGRTDYFVANSYVFQGLKSSDDNDTIPFVAPKLDYYHFGDVDAVGGRTDVHLDLAVLTRTDGTDTRRASARAGWTLPLLGPIGDLYTLSATLWGDAYHVNDLERDGSDNRYTGFSGRLFPQLAGEWRLPFARAGETSQQIIEPIVQGVLAPTFGNPSRIPNEDSEDMEFDTTNLFALNRFAGLDQVEEGPRFSYGLSWSYFGADGERASVFSGQSYRFFEDSAIPTASGLSGNFSDVVTAVDLAPNKYLDLLYRNRIDVSEAAARRHELGAVLGSELLRVGASYVRFDEENDDGTDFEGREELGFSLSSQLNRYWRTRIAGVRDLKGGGAQRDLGIRLTYEDECFLFTFGYKRADIEDRDIEPSDIFYVRLGFKTLGTVGAGLRQRDGG